MSRLAVVGGIGSGKTAATDYLATRGATVVDADVVAREIVLPGAPAWQQLRDAFGDAILMEDGNLDRAFVADVVFHDRSALRRLNAITHTQIGLEIIRRIDEAPTSLVVVALPLYRPEHRELFSLDEVWCIVVDPETAVRRLTQHRGMREDDARARLANQMTNVERTALCTEVISNEGSLDDLQGALDGLLKRKGLLDG